MSSQIDGSGSGSGSSSGSGSGSGSSSSVLLSKFNTMIEEAADAITCDSNCQAIKKGNNLEQNYLNAKTNLKTAPDQLFASRKQFVIFNQGEPAYNDMIDAELNEKADTISAFFAQNFNKEADKATVDVDVYSGLLKNLKNVVDLYLKYKKENAMLTKEIKQETNDILTNERKSYYQSQGTDFLKAVYSYFLIGVYVLLVVIYFGFAVKTYFADTAKWKLLWKTIGVTLVSMIVLPFISAWLLSTFISLLYNIYGLLPKNMHVSI